MNIPPNEIRPPAIAGTWYEGDPDLLRDMVARYMELAKPVHTSGDIVGIVVPHAGHVYSGPVAGYAYRQLIGRTFDTVVIIAPNHVDPQLTFSSVLTSGAYETPLGVVPVDQEAAEAIVAAVGDSSVRASGLGQTAAYAGRMEHSVEIQLPFLQVALESFRMVPIVMGNHGYDAAMCRNLGRAIARAVVGKRALIVASSDLSHFHQGAIAENLDRRVGDFIERLDPEGLLADLAAGKSEACGGLPIAVALFACRELGGESVQVLNVANSGDVTGDYSNVVGYLAAVITVSGDGGGISEVSEETEPVRQRVGVDLGLSEQDKSVLEDVVRETLEAVVNGRPLPVFSDRSGKLGEPWGAFVTLTSNDSLRGCIGRIVADKPLIQTVAEMARAAALEDPRFPSVQPAELPRIEFEISVLTPIRPMTDIDDIVIGRDGLIVRKGWNQGLLLPQVATEYGWDRVTFLEQTCIKAGLPRNAWRDPDAVTEVFSAEVFR